MLSGNWRCDPDVPGAAGHAEDVDGPHGWHRDDQRWECHLTGDHRAASGSQVTYRDRTHSG